MHPLSRATVPGRTHWHAASVACGLTLAVWSGHVDGTCSCRQYASAGHSTQLNETLVSDTVIVPLCACTVRLLARRGHGKMHGMCRMRAAVPCVCTGHGITMTVSDCLQPILWNYPVV
eukprot:2226251-Rhodomonas_salina.3